MGESDSTITIVTWNVNGISAVYGASEIKQGLDAFQADVICFQQTRVSRETLPGPIAIVEGYNSYYSFARNRRGYSGVATYCRNDFTPFKADDGLSGVLTSIGPTAVGYCRDVGSKFSVTERYQLDCEGRAVMTQHKFTVPGSKEQKDLVVINVYCPQVDPTNDERLQMKLMFYDLLETRVRALLEGGYHVMIAGDINTVHKPIDHCDPSEFEQSANPGRVWLNNILWDPEKGSSAETKSDDLQLIDAFRYLHPKEENAFTCWSTQLNARATNHGTRTDYILIDAGLKGRVKECSILRDVTGSDHCPMRIVLNVNGLCSPCPPTASTGFFLEFFGLAKNLFRFNERENVGKKKRKPTLTQIQPKRQKGIEHLVVKSTMPLENVAASSSSVKLDGSETTSSPHKDNVVTENTVSASSVTEQFVVKSPMPLENVSASSSSVKLDGSETTSSPHEDNITTENTVAASSVTVLESEQMDENLPSTSSVSDVKMAPASKEEDTQELKSLKSTAALN